MPRMSLDQKKEKARQVLGCLSTEQLQEVGVSYLVKNGIKGLSKQAFGRIRKELLNGHATNGTAGAAVQEVEPRYTWDECLRLVGIARKAAQDAGSVRELKLGIALMEGAV